MISSSRIGYQSPVFSAAKHFNPPFPLSGKPGQCDRNLLKALSNSLEDNQFRLFQLIARDPLCFPENHTAPPQHLCNAMQRVANFLIFSRLAFCDHLNQVGHLEYVNQPNHLTRLTNPNNTTSPTSLLAVPFGGSSSAQDQFSQLKQVARCVNH